MNQKQKTELLKLCDNLEILNLTDYGLDIKLGVVSSGRLQLLVKPAKKKENQ